VSRDLPETQMQSSFPSNPRQAFAKWRRAEKTSRCEGGFNTMKNIAFLALPAAFVLAVTPSLLAADGKAVYADNCTKCHGDDGKGQTKMGLKLQARDYSDAKVQDSFTDAEALKAIKDGMKKDDKTLMKPSELAEDDIKASIAYLRTLKK
jgi:cytochrome c6